MGFWGFGNNTNRVKLNVNNEVFIRENSK